MTTTKQDDATSQPGDTRLSEHAKRRPWERMSWEEESRIIREAQERRISKALDALIAGDEDWWRVLDSNELTYRRESGAVLALFAKKMRHVVSP